MRRLLKTPSAAAPRLAFFALVVSSVTAAEALDADADPSTPVCPRKAESIRK
jgi:hypothetical protein